MTAQSPVTRAMEPRASLYRRMRYDAFQVGETGRTYALKPLAADSLEEALNEVVSLYALGHKDHLLIRATGDEGVKLHLFVVKRKATPRYVYKNYVTRPVHDLYAAPVCTIDGSMLDGAL